MLPPPPTSSSGKAGEGDYVLDCWKVKEGTLVRTGETVALACLASNKKEGDKSGETATTAAPAPAKVAHKRPTRRKLTAKAPILVGAAAAVAAGFAGNVELKSITIFPTATGGAEKKKDNSSQNIAAGAGATSSGKKQPQSIPIVAPTTGFVRIYNSSNNSGSKNKLAIGYIEPCSHPAVVDGLCGVCGIPMPKDSSANVPVPSSLSSSTGNSSSQQSSAPRAMSQVTVSGGLTFTVSEQEGIQIGRQNAARLKQLKKLSLVLDLDHTLVHATADVRASKHLNERNDVRSLVLSMSEDVSQQNHNMWMQHFVKLRPNVKEFLEETMPMYEISVYTAGTRQYAEQIATVLCRHLVGATHDQIQLDRMRYDFARAEAELQAQPTADDEDKVMTTQPQPQRDETSTGKTVGEDQIINDGEGGEQLEDDGEPSSKKRRVMFTENTKPPKANPPPLPPPEMQAAPRMTAEFVARLKAELEEAENLEIEATEMRQRVFGSRIVSRSDVGDLGRDVKSLKRIFPCGGTMAAVVDDREDVWANAKDNNIDPNDKASSRRGEPPENLLLVKPYHWQPFVGFADINNASGVDLSEKFDEKNPSQNPKTETDVQLLWTADVLKRLHDRYYNQEDGESKTAPEILHDMRKEVLHGFKIVLSGLVPLHKQTEENRSAGPRPPIVRYAESLGGALISNVRPDTAFVVAARDGTDKILQARKVPGCSVVKVSWLMECFWTMRQRDPNQHLLAAAGREIFQKSMANGRAAKPAAVKAGAKSGEGDWDDDDDGDDDFAAQMEEDFM